MVHRFFDAQRARQNGHATAHEEISNGQKQSCWIWWIFPQLRFSLPELHSDTSERYSLRDTLEAYAYLKDYYLFQNYLTMSKLVLTKVKDEKIPLHILMNGVVDELKCISSLILFREMATDLVRTAPHSSARYQELATVCQEILTIVNAEQLPIYKRVMDCITIEKDILRGTNYKDVKIDQEGTDTPPPSIKSALIQELDTYIRQRNSEPSYCFQGLFKGYSKRDKLKAAISLRLALSRFVDPDIGKIITNNGFNMKRLLQRDCLQDLDILRQGRLGDCLRRLAKSDEYDPWYDSVHQPQSKEQQTVRNLVEFIQEQRDAQLIAPKPKQP